MTQKRKAELQRKLSVAPVPRPPDGLADRIKADIPKYLLDAEGDRARLSRSIGFNLRVAASILLLVGGAFFMIAVLSRTGMKEQATPAPAAAATVADVSPLKKETDRFTAAPPASQVLARADEKKDVGQNQVSLDAKANGRRAVAVGKLEEAETRERDRSLAFEDAVQEISASASAPVVSPAPPPAPPPAPLAVPMAPAPEPVAPPREEAQKTAVYDAVPKAARTGGGFLTPAANAAVIPAADRSKVFGISIDPQAFDRLKVTIERGEQPDARSVDVEALVNYFAGPPLRKMPRNVNMEVEVSSAPLTTGMCCVLRVTVDTAASDSPLPVAKAARLEVAFEKDAVRTFERVGGDGSTTLIQPILLPKTSVTALYNFQLQPNLKGRRRLGVVTLRYDRLPDGKERTLTYKISLDDLSESWVNGSRRHKLASLGALWGESLKDAAPTNEVAVKAKELAKQEPSDERARELAAASQLTEKNKEQR